MTFIHLFRDNLSGVFLSIVFFVLKNLPVWVLPLITSSIINEVTSPDDNTMRGILISFGLGVIVVGQNIPMQQAETYFTSRVVRDIEMRLRSSIVRKLQHLTISFHKNLSSGRIQSKVLRDVDNIEALSKTMVTNMIQAIFNIVVFAAITLTKSVVVAIFFIVTVPVAAFLIKGFRGSIRKTVTEFRKEIEHMSSDVSEMVEMLPVTKAHGLEHVETAKIGKQLEQVQEKAIKTDTVQTLFGSSSYVAFNLSQLACLCFTGYLAYKKKITVGEIALYQSYFAALLGNVNGLIGLYPSLAKGFESLGSISEILASRDIEKSKGKLRLKDVHGNYKFEHVNFVYPDDPTAPVLIDFNLEVKKGECIAFVGESGSGKTTLLNLLIGFHYPTGGNLFIDGHNIKDINLTVYRHHIAVVSQNNILFSGSVKDNITYGLPAVSKSELEKIIALANLTEVIESLPDGIDTNIGEHGDRLSGGQKQRIAIARAMIRNPDIILLDEATSALDNVSELHVQQAMDELIRDRTTFIVAHRLSTIRNADRIIVMRQGKCVETGTYEELLEMNGYFSELASLQVK